MPAAPHPQVRAYLDVKRGRVARDDDRVAIEGTWALTRAVAAGIDIETVFVGDTYDRTEYVRRNTQGPTVWHSQTLVDPEVVVVGDTAVLYTQVHDVVQVPEKASEDFRMPMTQVGVRSGRSWKCLAGHAGPRLS